MDGWLPISTAPRDGSWFFTKVITEDDYQYDVAKFDTDLDDFVKAGCGFKHVTHWRPAEPAITDLIFESTNTIRESLFWLIIREPGRVPDRKGPWPLKQTASILREFMAANPQSFIDYLTIGADGSPYVEHGPEVLQMTDGRSMSVGSKHNARVREAATAALPTLSAAAVCQGEESLRDEIRNEIINTPETRSPMSWSTSG
ncbi:hypothetical protein SUS17_2081 [Sphingomonas sp. S17]|uniref:hypothetical protein n=1 Tax=Sphingomonas sp. S17 TaxID=1007104 RepID=UPI00020A24E5|nr:hypothetical protein [Sphingomonas sp. S17]EGI55000.1 hypothetical protein SUS17_2081 [Sphingomonas sp. S17]